MVVLPPWWWSSSFSIKEESSLCRKAIPEQRKPNKEITSDPLAKSVATYILPIIRNCKDKRQNISPSGIFYCKEFKAHLRLLLLWLKIPVSWVYYKLKAILLPHKFFLFLFLAGGAGGALPWFGYIGLVPLLCLWLTAACLSLLSTPSVPKWSHAQSWLHIGEYVPTKRELETHPFWGPCLTPWGQHFVSLQPLHEDNAIQPWWGWSKRDAWEGDVQRIQRLGTNTL